MALVMSQRLQYKTKPSVEKKSSPNSTTNYFYDELNILIISKKLLTFQNNENWHLTGSPSIIHIFKYKQLSRSFVFKHIIYSPIV